MIPRMDSQPPKPANPPTSESAFEADRYVGEELAGAPLRPIAAVGPEFGRFVVVAPHPDDETLGCGGLIALMARRDPENVRVIIATDGTASHPNSKLFPPEQRRDMREKETVAALTSLGLPDAANKVEFLRLQDANMPDEESDPRYLEALGRMGRALRRWSPQTVLTTWRREPHGDHRRTTGLVAHCIAAEGVGRVRMLEYPVWLWENGQPGDWPRHGEMRAWRLDIRPVVTFKREAILSHRSQVSNVITDVPDGFRLSQSMLGRFAAPWEVFLEEN